MTHKNVCDGCIIPCKIPLDYVDDEFHETANNYNEKIEINKSICPCSKCLIKMKCDTNCQDFLDHLSYVWEIVEK
jgi:hypothetical protein